MKILNLMIIFLMIQSCGSVCEKENSCSSNSDEKSEPEETTEEPKEEVKWELSDIDDANLLCQVDEYSDDMNYIKYCQCKIEIIAQRWSFERHKRHAFVINRGLSDSGILSQCEDYAFGESDELELPELPEDVIEAIEDDLIAEEASE